MTAVSEVQTLSYERGGIGLSIPKLTGIPTLRRCETEFGTAFLFSEALKTVEIGEIYLALVNLLLAFRVKEPALAFEAFFTLRRGALT